MPQKQPTEDIEEAINNVDRGGTTSSSKISLRTIFIIVCFAAALGVVAVLMAPSLPGTKHIGYREPAATKANMEIAVQRPNFIFVLIDDLAWNAFHTPGYEIFSPVMTGLMNDGIYLNKYYSQESSSPARSALLTGRYPSSIGINMNNVPNAQTGLNLSEVLLPQVLKDHGRYINYMVGKWHLGYYSPKYLPTARGFDHFLGYLNGVNSYWSKMHPDVKYADFMVSDNECFYNYEMVNRDHQYSTILYERKAVKAIIEHDYKKNPMFLYFASQAVHTPFGDAFTNMYKKGMTIDYVGQKIYEYSEKNIIGEKRQEMFRALFVLDDTIGTLIDALKKVHQYENTYIIVTSDNGGSCADGGRSAPLRGTKGTFWEGGTKVDAFIHSPLIPIEKRGTRYNGLMHITDWFPTILALAGINSFTAAAGFELDGVEQATAILKDENSNLRRYMLYGIDSSSSKNGGSGSSSNKAIAVRDERYKLAHIFNDNADSKICSIEEASPDTDDILSTTATTAAAATTSSSGAGSFSRMLFDLDTDISESVNLFGQEEFSEVQERLTKHLERFASIEKPKSPFVTSPLPDILAYFDTHGNIMQPWVVEPIATTDSTASATTTSSTAEVASDDPQSSSAAAVDVQQSLVAALNQELAEYRVASAAIAASTAAYGSAAAATTAVPTVQKPPVPRYCSKKMLFNQ